MKWFTDYQKIGVLLIYKMTAPFLMLGYFQSIEATAEEILVLQKAIQIWSDYRKKQLKPFK